MQETILICSIAINVWLGYCINMFNVRMNVLRNSNKERHKIILEQQKEIKWLKFALKSGVELPDTPSNNNKNNDHA